MEQMTKKWKLKWIYKSLLLCLADILIVMGSYFMALFMRFDFQIAMIPEEYLAGYFWSMPFWIVSTIVIYYIYKLYHSIWAFVSIAEVKRIVMADLVLIPVYIFGAVFMELHMPKSYYFMGYIISCVCCAGVRFSYRYIRFYLRSLQGETKEEGKERDRIMVIGAGTVGQTLIREIRKADSVYAKVVCAIDDNPEKKGRILEGIPIVGNRYDIVDMVKKYDVNRIIYAIPSTTGQNRKDILNLCKEAGCRMQTVPSVSQIVNEEVSMTKLREVEISDLLGRKQILVNMDEITEYIRGKVVLVTGGGGSIGSELCRQVAAREPKQLIILDIYENNAYDIQMELRKKYPQLNLEVIIASVRDSRKMFKVFKTYHPDIVYHAAAHKHVPLMEDSPCESIKNNAIGTYKTAFAAIAHGTKKFVLISTDKAVNPTNIMGASKRLCEMIIQAFDSKVKEGKADEIPQIFTHAIQKELKNMNLEANLRNARTEFVAVRFGNVLGSNGSVIPLFKKQIEAGGPVTVTDPEIIRYFMTIPEAVSLVMQAGTYARGGEIFVLDMGEPVKIDTLARNLIRLSGYRPDEDIKIEYTGLRPGEKLYEEKLMAEEGLKRTENELIHIGMPIPFDINEFLADLDELTDKAYANVGDIRELVEKMVSTYHPAED
ncbi:polysaccharide biosynthesis protein [Faecalicatena sp. Marseille-Q4148]|nr:polysaccharide biosynthesis protein [Faecalicatena sp. Marseille-Q4148]